MKKIFKSLLVCIIPGILVSCNGLTGNKLSKDQAAKLIVKEGPFNSEKSSSAITDLPKEYHKASRSLDNFTACAELGYDEYNGYKDVLNELKNKGLITLHDKDFPNANGRCSFTRTIVALTDEGNKYLIWQGTKKVRTRTFLSSYEMIDKDIITVKLCNETFDSITSIVPHDSITEVNYSTRYDKYNPFGEILIKAYDADDNYLVKNRDYIGKRTYHTANFKNVNGEWQLIK